jgi:predicted PurR-regulated permease PerM
MAEDSNTAAARSGKNSSRSLQTWFLLGLLALGLFFACILLLPFADTLILAVMVAALSHPIYAFFLKKLRGREALSSLIVLLFVCILVVLPLTLLIGGLISQMRYSVVAGTAWLSGGNLDTIFTSYLNPLFDWISEEAPFLGVTAESAKADILNAARRAGQKLIGLSANFVGQTLTFGMHFLLFLVALFFFLKDGSGMIAHLKQLTPLREKQMERIIENLRTVSKSVLLGGFLVAALQGLVGGIGLAIVGIPALFWGTVMAFTAFVPVVGPSLVWIPAVLVLLFHDEWKSALFLAVWCSLLVSSIDTFLRPFLMRDSSGVPALFLFFAILGGIQVFGILGLFYGPIILAFAVVMLNIYADEYHEQLHNKDA